MPSPISSFGVLLLIVFSPVLLDGQDLAFDFQVLTEEDGLPPSAAFFISQDSRGYVWIGTSAGIKRFDGSNLLGYGATSDKKVFDQVVTSYTLEDADGNLWFTTKNSLYCYHWARDSLMGHQLSGSTGEYHAFHLDVDGVIWLRIGLGEDGMLWKFDPQTSVFSPTYQSLEGKICTPQINEAGVVERILQTEHLIQPGLQTLELNTRKMESIDFMVSESGEELVFSGKSSGVVIMEDGTVWTGIYNGLGKYSPGAKNGFFADDRLPGMLEDFGFIRALVQINDQQLLAGGDQGLFLFDLTRSAFIAQYVADGKGEQLIPFSSVTKLELLPDGTLWLGGENGEIAYTKRLESRFAVLPQSADQSVKAIALDPRGHIWSSTEKAGTFVFSPEKKLWRHSTVLDNPSYGGNEPFSLPMIDFFLGASPDDWWANVENYFLAWNAEKRQFTFQPDHFFGVPTSTENKINYCKDRANGEVLMALGRKVYRLEFNGNEMDTLPWFNLQYLQLAPIVFIGEDAEEIVYLGDESGRLIAVRENGGQLDILADFKNLGTIHALHQDTNRNTIWLATSQGLAQLDPATFSLSWYTEAEHQLPRETYYNVLPDAQGQLWLPGNNGLVRYHPETRAFHRFTTADGLLANVFAPNAGLTVPETGEIWLGSKKGINIFHPKDISLSDFQPNISFSELLVNDEPFVPTGENQGNLNEKKHLKFKYADNTLSFQFVALDYSNPEANEYYYQMEGYDDERVYAGKKNFVRYPNLPAGAYNFKVWATNSDKVLNAIPKVLALTIVPPFYQRWWFYLACLLFIGAGIFAIFKYRLEQALKVERLRVKISSDLHDDVGGMLSGLAMQTEILELTATEETKPKLARIADLSRSAMSRMRDTVWAIDARKDKLENLVDRMREHAEETLSPRSMQYAIQVENLDLKRDLPTDVRQNLYLIFKETVTNAAKHSNGDTVNIRLRNTGGGFEMLIHDNGRVPEKKHKTTGLGQGNLRLRAEAIGASLEVETREGFLVRLRRKEL